MKRNIARRTLVIVSVATLCMGLVLTVWHGSTPKVSAQNGCTLATLIGGYGAATAGFINSSSNPNDITIGTFVPFAEAVHFNFDGRGNVSGSSTADYGGQSFPVTFTGSYSVNPNCTGSATFNLGDDNLVHRNLVIVAEGKEVEFVSTDLGLVIAGSMKRR